MGPDLQIVQQRLATSAPPDAVLVARRRNRQTGTVIELLDNANGGFELGGLRWITLCTDHGNYCEHDTRELATSFVAAPAEWCGECDDILTVARRGGETISRRR